MKYSRLLTVVVALLVFGLIAGPVGAAESFFGISLFEPVQYPDENTSIKGFRLNLFFGAHKDITGIDVGLLNGLWGDMSGIQFGAANRVKGDLAGLQFGVFNLTDGRGRGIQFGGFNYAGTLRGVQVGVINRVDRLQGLQLGLLNIRSSPSRDLLGGRPPKFMPFINWAF